MRDLLLPLTAVAALTVASPVAAQTSAPDPSLASPAVAKAEGERILSEAQAADLFDNITAEDETTRLRHKASGMVCLFDPLAPGNAVRVYPQGGMTPNRGDDVSCSSILLGATYTLYATRYRTMPSEAEDMASAIAGIRSNWTDVEPLQDAFGIASVEGRNKPLFAAFKGRRPQGQEAGTFVLISHIDGWSFKTRASGPIKDAQTIALTAGLMSISSIPPLAD